MPSSKRHKTCDVRGCYVSSKDVPMTFFAFPHPYQHTFEAWYNFANCEVPNPRWICERHFAINQYEDRIKAILFRHAVPTLYPGLTTPINKEDSPLKPAKKVPKIKRPKIEVVQQAPDNCRNRFWSRADATVPKAVGQYNIPPRNAPPITQNLNRYGTGHNQQKSDDDGFLAPKTISSPIIVRTADGFVIPGQVKRAPPNFAKTLSQHDQSNNAEDSNERLGPSPPKVKRLSKQPEDPSDEIDASHINWDMDLYKKLSESLPFNLQSTKFKQAIEELKEASKKKKPFPTQNSITCHNNNEGLNSFLSSSHIKNVRSQVTNEPPPKLTTLVLKPSSKKFGLNIDKSSFQITLKSKPKIITAKPKVQAGKHVFLKGKTYAKKLVPFGGNALVTKSLPEGFPKVPYGTPKSLPSATNLPGENVASGSRLVKVDPKPVPQFLNKLTVHGNNDAKVLIPDKSRLVKVDPKLVPESVKTMLKDRGIQDSQKQALSPTETASKEKTLVAEPGASAGLEQGNDDVIIQKPVEVPPREGNILKSAVNAVYDKINSEPVPGKSRVVKVDVRSLPESIIKKLLGKGNAGLPSQEATPTLAPEPTPNRNHIDYDDDDVIFLESDTNSSSPNTSSFNISSRTLKSAGLEKSEKISQSALQTSSKADLRDNAVNVAPGTVSCEYDGRKLREPDLKKGQENIDDDDVIFLKSVNSPSIDQTMKSSKICLPSSELSVVHTPKNPTLDARTSNKPTGAVFLGRFPCKMKLIKVDLKSIPEHLKGMVDGKINNGPRAKKPESPLAVQIKEHISAEIHGTVSVKKDDAKAREYVSRKYAPDPMAELWEAYVAYKDKMLEEPSKSKFDIVSFLKLKLESNDPMTPEMEKTALELISKVHRTYSRSSNDTLQSSTEQCTKRAPLILRRSAQHSRSSNVLLDAFGQDPILSKVVDSSTKQTPALTPPKSDKLVQIKLIGSNKIYMMDMKHMMNCYVKLVDVLQQKQIIEKYLPSTKKEGAVSQMPNARSMMNCHVKLVDVRKQKHIIDQYLPSTKKEGAVTPMPNASSKVKKSNVCTIDLTDDPTLTLDVPSKRRKRRTNGEKKKFSKVRNELEQRVLIVGSSQQVDVTKLYGGFTVLQHAMNVFELSSFSSTYVQLFAGTAMVESSVNPSYMPGFLCTPLTTKEEADVTITVFVDSQLVSQLNKAVQGLKSTLKELKPFASCKKEEINNRHYCEYSSLLEHVPVEVAVLEVALLAITSKNALNPTQLRANAVKLLPCIDKMTVIRRPFSSDPPQSSSAERDKSTPLQKAALQQGTGGTDQSTVPTKSYDPSLPQSVIFVVLMVEDINVRIASADQSSSASKSYKVMVQLCYDKGPPGTDYDHGSDEPLPSRSVQPNSAVSRDNKGSKPANGASHSTAEQPAMLSSPSSYKKETCFDITTSKAANDRNSPAPSAESNSDSITDDHDYSIKLSDMTKSEHGVDPKSRNNYHGSEESPLTRPVQPNSTELEDIEELKPVNGAKRSTAEQQAMLSSPSGNKKDNRLDGATSKAVNDSNSRAPKTDSNSDCVTGDQGDIIKPLTKSLAARDEGSTYAKSQARIDVNRLFGGFAMLQHAARNLPITGVTFADVSVLRLATAILEASTDENVAVMLISDFLNPSRFSLRQQDMARKQDSLVFIEQNAISKVAAALTRIRSIIHRISPVIGKLKKHVPPNTLRELRLIVEDFRALVSDVKNRIPANFKQKKLAFPGNLLGRSVTVRIIIPKQSGRLQSIDVGLSGRVLAFSWMHVVDSHHDELLEGVATLLTKCKGSNLDVGVTWKHIDSEESQSQNSSKKVTAKSTVTQTYSKSRVTTSKSQDATQVVTSVGPEESQTLPEVIHEASGSSRAVSESGTTQGLVDSVDNLTSRRVISSEKVQESPRNPNVTIDSKVSRPLFTSRESLVPPESTNVDIEPGAASGRPERSASGSQDASEELTGTQISLNLDVCSSSTIEFGKASGSSDPSNADAGIETPSKSKNASPVFGDSVSEASYGNPEMSCSTKEPKGNAQLGAAATAESFDHVSETPCNVTDSDKSSESENPCAAMSSKVNNLSAELQESSESSNIPSDSEPSSSEPPVPIDPPDISHCNTEDVCTENSPELSDSQNPSKFTQDLKPKQSLKRSADVESEETQPKIRKTPSPDPR